MIEVDKRTGIPLDTGPGGTPKTVTELREMRLFMIGYYDSEGRFSRKLGFVYPDGAVFTTSVDIPLVGVNLWFRDGVHQLLAKSGYRLKKEKGDGDK